MLWQPPVAREVSVHVGSGECLQTSMQMLEDKEVFSAARMILPDDGQHDLTVTAVHESR